MKKRLVSVVLVAAFAFSMLAGCGSDNSASKDNNKTSAEAEQTATNSGDGFNITVNFASEPMTMDPALNSSVDGAIMANHLFEGLMKWESTGEEVEGSDGTCDSAKLTYGQAESYDKTANDDGTVTYTFHLRDGIKWSDGKDVTAGDFEYAWKRLVNPATAADYNYMLDCVVNANEIMAGEKDPSELAVKAVDDKTFEVTLTTDLPYFDELCAFPAMMGSCAFLMAFGNGPKFISAGRFDPVACWTQAIFGAIGVYVAYKFVGSMDINVLTKVIVVVVYITAFLYLHDAIKKGDAA